MLKVVEIMSFVRNGRVGPLRKNLSAKPDLAQTPGLFALAADYGQIGVLELLLEYGASVHDTDELGQDGLFHASINADVGLTKWLLAHGAVPTAQHMAEATRVREENAAKADWDYDAWVRCAVEVLETLATARRKVVRRKLRVAIGVVAELLAWQARAAERAYMPGGLGAQEAQADFAERATGVPSEIE